MRRQGILEAEQLKLTGHHFYFLLLGTLYTGLDDVKARAFLQRALEQAKTPADEAAIRKKIDRL